jgi:hypothetical protein
LKLVTGIAAGSRENTGAIGMSAANRKRGARSAKVTLPSPIAARAEIETTQTKKPQAMAGLGLHFREQKVLYE